MLVNANSTKSTDAYGRKRANGDDMAVERQEPPH
jgi:hypothetical protein